ncbi:uncharacterized protein AB675_8248 [Cyphellophora attinorum]|uniref:Uncharacterized protein n=1 Tax=Cyphellophora attinorum TaxID=1664694 RepID=A0A0N1HWD5_9EURO|nr:uncharacterized protein AB675_8248 [Phialophora attinorum]KPI44456.1 hypothetical protein AB675_8248 [Phialophora attinorum]
MVARTVRANDRLSSPMSDRSSKRPNDDENDSTTLSPSDKPTDFSSGLIVPDRQCSRESHVRSPTAKPAATVPRPGDAIPRLANSGDNTELEVISSIDIESTHSRESASDRSTAAKRKFAPLEKSSISTGKKGKVTSSTDRCQEPRRWGIVQGHVRPSDAYRECLLSPHNYEALLMHEAEPEAVVLVDCGSNQIVRWPRDRICHESAVILDFVASDNFPVDAWWDLSHAAAQAIERWLRRGTKALWEKCDYFGERYDVKRLRNDLVDEMLNYFMHAPAHELWPSEAVDGKSPTGAALARTDEMLLQFVKSGISVDTILGQLLSQHLARHLTLDTAGRKTLQDSEEWLKLCETKHDLWTATMSKWTLAVGKELKHVVWEDRCTLHDHHEDTYHHLSIQADDVLVSTQDLNIIKGVLASRQSVELRSWCEKALLDNLHRSIPRD